MQQFILIYNYSRSIQLTLNGVVEEHFRLYGSVEATLGAIFFLLQFTSTVYHLLFISVLRLYAIIKPLKYRNLRKSSIFIGLVIVWVIAIVVASSLGKFTNFVAVDLRSIFCLSI